MTENKRFIIYSEWRNFTSDVKDTTGEITTLGEFVDLLNELNDENEHYKQLFFEIVETALTDKNCREEYCKGVLGVFDKANSLNQAREMIKEHLE